MIDWDRVNELRLEVGAEDFADVVEIFLEEVDEVITRLTDQPDPATFEDDLHFLKGCALNLGFAALSDICQDGEQKAASGDADSIDIPAVIETYGKSKQEFLARQIGDSAAA